jgi:hypothetical protein
VCSIFVRVTWRCTQYPASCSCLLPRSPHRDYIKNHSHIHVLLMPLYLKSHTHIFTRNCVPGSCAMLTHQLTHTHTHTQTRTHTLTHTRTDTHTHTHMLIRSHDRSTLTHCPKFCRGCGVLPTSSRPPPTSNPMPCPPPHVARLWTAWLRLQPHWRAHTRR